MNFDQKIREAKLAAKTSAAKKGCTLRIPIIGITAAVCMSWVFNHSALWAIFHGFCNWFYVAYKTIWYVVTHY